MKLGKVRGVFLLTLVFGTIAFYLQMTQQISREYVRIRSETAEKEMQVATYSQNSSDSENLALHAEVDVAKKFADRLHLLHSRCPTDYLKSRERFQWVPKIHFLVDVPKRLLVCVVPKSGSSTWHGIIWALRRTRAGLDDDQKFYRANDTVENHAMAKKLSLQDGEFLGTYNSGDDDIQSSNGSAKLRGHRLILARHPFARLISGWKDKFRTKSNYWERFFERYPKILSYRVSDPPANYTLAFEDFAQYIAENGHDIRRLEYHFKPANYLCEPCKYAYNYILKAERIDEDQTWLMKSLNLNQMHIVRRGVSKGTLLQSNPSNSIKEKFQNLPIHTIKKLFTIYEQDFYYFGYTFNFTTLESGGFD